MCVTGKLMCQISHQNWTRKMQGKLIAIVGPSGVGKDSVMRELLNSSDVCLVKRVVTRPVEASNEDHFEMDVKRFRLNAECGALILKWEAHGLHYGITYEAIQPLFKGQDMLVNLSRKTLEEANNIFENFLVINLTAPKSILESRLKKRGRETSSEIIDRVNRKAEKFHASIKKFDVSNNRLVFETAKEIKSILKLNDSVYV